MDVPPRQLSLDELRALLPRGKFDSERAQAITALGYPAVAPVLPELLTWLQDINWPIASTIADFLRTIGPPLAPEIRRVFATDDFIWKHWIVRFIVHGSPELIAELRPELERMALRPTPAEMTEELHEAAREALASLTT